MRHATILASLLEERLSDISIWCYGGKDKGQRDKRQGDKRQMTKYKRIKRRKALAISRKCLFGGPSRA